MVVVQVDALPLSRANTPGRWAAARIRVLVMDREDPEAESTQRRGVKVWSMEVNR